MPEGTRDLLFTEELRARLLRCADVDLDRPVTDVTACGTAELADVEVLLTGWGAPRLDLTAVDRMPQLRAVVHAAGSIRPFMDAAVVERGILVSTAAHANAIPVAEFTVAAIVFATKRVGIFAHHLRTAQTLGRQETEALRIGTYGATVGLVGASRVGRAVATMLRAVDVHVLLSDPYASAADASELGVELVPLDELVRRSDVVSIHAPELPETRHLIDASRLAAMRDGGTLINTARGSLVDTEALVPEVISGRLHAVLDVTDPEPLPAGHPLLHLPNVLVTPHVAGSLGTEMHRLGEHAVAEVERLAAGSPLAHPLRAADLLHGA
ncbi:MAG: hydroxyacid dehydrogenase [Nocardioidaceae bacterium]|nr:hydroxyacid dehydrogenase [Nocardioidaceae bacterium]